MQKGSDINLVCHFFFQFFYLICFYDYILFILQPSLGIGSSKKALLYVITGPVGAYYSTGSMTPISLLANPKYVRSFPGGVGDKKMGW